MLHNINNKKNIKLKYYTSKYNNCNSENDTKTEDDKKMNEKDLNKTIIL